MEPGRLLPSARIRGWGCPDDAGVSWRGPGGLLGKGSLQGLSQERPPPVAFPRPSAIRVQLPRLPVLFSDTQEPSPLPSGAVIPPALPRRPLITIGGQSRALGAGRSPGRPSQCLGRLVREDPSPGRAQTSDRASAHGLVDRPWLLAPAERKNDSTVQTEAKGHCSFGFTRWAA